MALLEHQYGSTVYQTNAKTLLLYEIKSWLGRALHRSRVTPRSSYLQIGSGQNILENFENLDFYSFSKRNRKVTRHDLRFPLPYPDQSFTGVFTEHCMEHLHANEVFRLMREICRVLKPGGVLRCAVPDLEKYINFYVGKPVDPEFSMYSSGCEAIWSLTQNWGHISVWDANMMTQKLREAGFSEAHQVGFREGRNPDLLIDQESRRWESLYVEAIR